MRFPDPRAFRRARAFGAAAAPSVILADAPVDTVVGVGSRGGARAFARLEALRGVDSPGVAVPAALTTQGRLAVASARRVDGPTLAEVVRARGGLEVGECAGLGVELARALAALHDAELAHGDVAPTNVVCSRHGAVLVDLVAPPGAGTPGFVAPERGLGAATRAGDIYSLGALLLWSANEDARDRIEAWARPLMSPDPASRPSAEVAARALARCAQPRRIGTLEPERSGLGLRGRARAPRTVGLPTARWWRAYRMAVRAAAVAGLVAAAATLVALGIRAFDAATPAAQPGYDPPLPVPAARVAASPSDAAVVLTRDRIGALAAGDPQALAATTLPGSPASDADAISVNDLAAGKAFEGLVVTDIKATVVAVAGDDATVRVSYALSGYNWDGMSYAATSAVAELDIRWVEQLGWRVVRARDLP